MRTDQIIERERKFKIEGKFVGLVEEISRMFGKAEEFNTFEQLWHPPAATNTLYVRSRQKGTEPLEVTVKSPLPKILQHKDARLETVLRLPPDKPSLEYLERSLGIPSSSFLRKSAVWNVGEAEVAIYHLGFSTSIYLEVECVNPETLDELCDKLDRNFLLTPEPRNVYELACEKGLVYLISRVAQDAWEKNNEVSSALRASGNLVYVPHEQDINQAPASHFSIFSTDFRALSQAARVVAVAPFGRDCSAELGWASANGVKVELATSKSVEFLEDPMIKGFISKVYTTNKVVFDAVKADDMLKDKVFLVSSWEEAFNAEPIRKAG